MSKRAEVILACVTDSQDSYQRRSSAPGPWRLLGPTSENSTLQTPTMDCTTSILELPNGAHLVTSTLSVPMMHLSPTERLAAFIWLFRTCPDKWTSGGGPGTSRQGFELELFSAPLLPVGAPPNDPIEARLSWIRRTNQIVTIISVTTHEVCTTMSAGLDASRPARTVGALSLN